MKQQCCLLFETTILYSQPRDQILYHRIEAMVQCRRGWEGDNCDVCATNFGPAGLCVSCVTGFAGENCSECDRGWAGSDCDVCDTNFGPPGQCDKCLAGFTGLECHTCQGFGFSTESNCTECIQNGVWVGKRSYTDLEFHFNFTESSCSELVTGRYVTLSRSFFCLLCVHHQRSIDCACQWKKVFVK